MKPLEHVMILASAGSGKTYALTNRFVELLAAGAEPERIVALTFTRKAAGEFFDEILQKLARAAGDPESAARLARDLGRPGLGAADFLQLLRRLVDAMHRLKLGTLDSFFARIARTFPFELGLTGEFEVLQEHAAVVERRRVLRRMFARSGDGLAAAQAEFIEAFKRATFGTDEKRLGARLDAFLDSHTETYLSAPDAACWGDASRIWPRGCRWLDDPVDLPVAMQRLRIELGAVTAGQLVRWDAFFAALAEWTPGAPLPQPVEYILKNALAVWPEIGRRAASMTVERKKQVLSAGACEALEGIIATIVGAEFRRRIETTRGIFAVLRGFDSVYHDVVRRAGRLTFADVQRLLQPMALSSGSSVAPARDGDDQLALSFDGGASADERRLLLDYRLDGEIDHWLLDEFQDTSFGQWSVLKNLIDEVVQDPEGRRSFFCVGDVKQAIYSWREGDPRLFREIFNQYNATSPTIVQKNLVASWRSGPALIEMVNEIFGDAAALSELFPGEATATWNREWFDHESAVPTRHGQAALLHAEDEAGRWAVTRALLEEIKPIERGLTCAVLVKKNDTAARLAEYLRSAGIPALAEADLHVATDNPLGAALLAVIQAAAHPGDTLAFEHVRMTPLGDVLSNAGLRTAELVSMRVLHDVHHFGFKSALEFWVTGVERLQSFDEFTRRRAHDFLSAAGLFDATGSRDCDEFIAFMQRHTVRAAETGGAVRLMTVHKSKGLGFDVVIVPDLQGNRIDERREGLAVQKRDDRSVDWILDLPPKLFCAQDEVLARHLSSAEADACYENLSLLYVALTRAKRAMYVVTEPAGNSTSRNFPRLLAETLGDETHDIDVGDARFGGAWSRGDSHWHLRVEPVSAGKRDARAALAPVAKLPSLRVRREAPRPSAKARGEVGAAGLFGLAGGAGAEFGSALHARFAEIEWSGDVQRWSRKWQADGETEAIIRTAIATLSAPELAAVWDKPSPDAEVWRERGFEIVLDGMWLTGVVDRVVVDRAADGAVTRVTVFDFKTDAVGSAAEASAAAARHDDQLDTYRRVVAVLAGVSADRVEAALVFTAVPCVVAV